MDIKEFLLKSEGLVVVYHWDADGICSAAQIGKFCRVKGYVPSQNDLEEDVIQEVKSLNPKDVVIVDVGGLSEKYINILENLSNLLIIDHHNRSSDNIKARESYIHSDTPVSYYIFKIIGDNNLKWIACTGTRGDKADRYCQDLFGNDIDIKKCRRAMGHLNAGKNYYGRKGAKIALKAVLISESPEDIYLGRNSYSAKLLEADRKIYVQTKQILSEFEKNAVICQDKKTVVFDIKNRLNLGSRISSILRWKLQGFFIVVINTQLNPVPVSIRISDNSKNILDVLKRTGFENYGGHADACGLKLEPNTVEKFIQRFISAVGDIYYNTKT